MAAVGKGHSEGGNGLEVVDGPFYFGDVASGVGKGWSGEEFGAGWILELVASGVAAEVEHV